MLMNTSSKFISGNAAICCNSILQSSRVPNRMAYACAAGQFLFALCEGNFCVGGKRGKKAGNGRLIISQLETDANDNTNCK